jgi:hypothetical protein
MSIRSSSGRKAGQNANRRVYLSKFVRHAHRLIALGYAQVDPATRTHTEEEEITESLANAITDLIESPGAQGWMGRYVVSDEVRLRHPTRRAKRRPRIDIQILYVKGTPRPRFHFEAKRLGPDNPVGDYLGDEGLGCFVTAQYARESDEAGMLGYVQNETCDSWAEKIKSSLHKDRAKHRMVNGTSWEAFRVIDELTHSYRTAHDRPSLGRPVSVYHTLLLFCQPSNS